jgi:hypothetical protein
MSYPPNNISAQAGHRQMVNSQAHAASRRRTQPAGVVGAIGRLIGLLVVLAFVGIVLVFILTVMSGSGLG